MRDISKIETQYFLSGNAPILYPADTLFCLLFIDTEKVLELPKRYPYKGEWGKPLSTHLLEHESYPIPKTIDLVWLSVVERKVYSLHTNLPSDKIFKLLTYGNTNKNKQIIKHIIVGMAPNGGVAIWIHENRKSFLAAWLCAETVPMDTSDMKSGINIDYLYDLYIKDDLHIKGNTERIGLPPRNLYNKYMQQFFYRYLPIYERFNTDKGKWQKYHEDETVPEFEFIEEALFDGTHDKLHDDGLLKYHKAGKPKKLAIKWHIKKTEYVAYFWFEDERIREVFDKFYGAHPDTKTDFIIRIDTENKKYELALYRYGLKEPQVIPEDVYQLLVFKNKFEDYRSDNYNQERGAWIW